MAKKRKKWQKDNNVLQNITHKDKDRATRTLPITGGKLRWHPSCYWITTPPLSGIYNPGSVLASLLWNMNIIVIDNSNWIHGITGRIGYEQAYTLIIKCFKVYRMT
jgi:hypothetical protein